MPSLAELAEPWVAWIAHGVHRGEPHQELVEMLVGQGLPRTDASSLVDEVAQSPVLRGLKQTLRAVELRRASLQHVDIARLPWDPQLYRQVFAAGQLPVVFTGATDDWPARAWTWRSLAARHGEQRVHATPAAVAGTLEVEPHPNEALRFVQALDGLLADPPRWVIRATDAAADHLSELLEDLRPLDGVAVDRGVALWFTPRGHTTPLHYDLSTTLLNPVLGRKRVTLVPPEAPVWSGPSRHYALPVDLDDPDLLARTVEIAPGDSLSVPAGWWHQVESLDAAAMVTLAQVEGFRNRFDDSLNR